MKKQLSLVVLCLTVLLNNSCDYVLEENPKASIPPSYFSTSAGVLGGIAGVYNDIRAQWGTEGFSTEMQVGTDEFLQGASGNSVLCTYNGLASTNFGGAWNTAFTDINTLNGVLEFGSALTDVPDATKKQYLAQAKFLRAFWYFYLVQTFGDVPLSTEFVTVPSQAAQRDPVADVYALILQDLNEAIVDLPNTPTAPFLGKAATKPVAQFLLAKAYLTHGWLTNNSSGTDFTNAATLCDDIITNKALYGYDLWSDFGDAFVPANDYGKETMFVSDHMNDAKYGYYTVGGGASGGAAQNLTPWFTNWNYPNNSGANSYKNLTSGALVNSGTSGMIRDSQYGRPYVRFRPNTDNMTTGPNAGKNYFLDQAFTNRTIDTRFSKSFYTTYISNRSITVNAGDANNSRGIGFTTTIGVDTAVWLPDFEVTGAPQRVGTRPFKGIVVPPSLWNNGIFPALKKFMDPSRGANFNDPSTRPVVIYRFAEVYLIGAEAHFKAGNSAKAVEYINVIRSRAAYKKTNSAGQNAAAVAMITATTATDLATGGIDYILDERTRELFGEWMRWHDLVRTQKLISRVTAWNKEAGPNIKSHHILRPIPQSQIDLTVEGPKFPQNTGY